MLKHAAAVCLAAGLCLSAAAQWNPAAGQVGKTDPRDVRVMTWNIRDSVCSTEVKTEARNSWTAIARTIAAFKPDILIMQECGDNSGNGTGGSIDSAGALATTIGLLIRGGNDPFLGGTVGAWVQKYDPAYDLPFTYVSLANDGFNRNVVVSRWPLQDLNGDNRVALDNSTVQADLYAPGGNFGIRGFTFAEINLPDASYRGDLVVGNGHLKSGGTSGDLAQRLTASQNLAYYIDYMFNGGGGPTPDPRSKINDSPVITQVLNAFTPVILGGDMNEDELNNSRKGPVEWLAQADITPGTDGTDRDRSDSTYDDARDIFNSSIRATQSSSKLDYLIWQDSIATLRRAHLINVAGFNASFVPPELVGYAGGYGRITGDASDHRAVFADFILPPPPAPSAFTLTAPADASVAVPLTPTFTWAPAADAVTYTLTIANDAALTSIVTTVPGLAGTSYALPASVLNNCQTYFWGVTAVNAFGSTASTPAAFTFDSKKIGDVNNDGITDLADFFEFLNCFDTSDPCADINGDSSVDLGDFFEYLNAFDISC